MELNGQKGVEDLEGDERGENLGQSRLCGKKSIFNFKNRVVCLAEDSIKAVLWILCIVCILFTHEKAASRSKQCEHVQSIMRFE